MLDDLFTIGQTFELGWNGAKLAGCELAAYEEVRVEAIGADWVIVRRNNFKPLAVAFDSLEEATTFRCE